MVALNLANEYLRLKEREAKLELEASGRVKALRERVEAQLAQSQQLEF
jgi:cell division protein ZapA (FtsZ GTPase activity inhibitor)